MRIKRMCNEKLSFKDTKRNTTKGTTDHGIVTPKLFKRLVVFSILCFLLNYACPFQIRRTVRFWIGTSPLIIEYKFLLFQKRIHDRWKGEVKKDEDDFTPSLAWPDIRLQRFHDRAAPQITKGMIQLGGIYIKLGQILSTAGSGLLNEAYVSALQPLQSGVPARKYSEISRIIEESTGRKMEEIFESFDENPVGAASIGQAHRATLRSAALALAKPTTIQTKIEVIVKVQYPEVADSFRMDFQNLELAIRFLEPKNIDHVKALRRRHENELDFRLEAENLREVTRNMQRHGVEPDIVRIPRVRNETGLCTDRVLVMEYLDGSPLSHLIEIEHDRFAKGLGLDDAKSLKAIMRKRMRRHFEKGGGDADEDFDAAVFIGSKWLQVLGPSGARLIRFFGGIKENIENMVFSTRITISRLGNVIGMRTSEKIAPENIRNNRHRKMNVNIGRVLKTLIHVQGLQLIKDGIFNVDPHPGNVLILPDGRLGLLDYGLVGRIEEEENRLRLAQLVLALTKNDKAKVAELYTQSGYEMYWKEGDVSDPNILFRFASLHFDRVDLSPVVLEPNMQGIKRKISIFKILRSARERKIPLWIENGRRLSALLLGVSNQAMRPTSLSKEWKTIALEVIDASKKNHVSLYYSV